MGQESAGQHGDAFAGDQLLSDAYRLARLGAVVARDHFELLAEHAAFGVDLLDGHFQALLVRIEERGKRLVAVDLADLDGVLRRCRRGKGGGENAREGEVKNVTPGCHDEAPCVAAAAC